MSSDVLEPKNELGIDLCLFVQRAQGKAKNHGVARSYLVNKPNDAKKLIVTSQWPGRRCEDIQVFQSNP